MADRVLMSWIGNTDLDAAAGIASAGLGPIAQAALDRELDEIVLLTDFAAAEATRYRGWLSEHTSAPIQLEFEKLASPIDYGDIYKAVISAVGAVLKRLGADAKLTYHLSPGTPAMAAVWIIVAKTRFPAELIESSVKFGVRTASVPFDISADFIPDLLRRPDEELARLAAGLPPEAPEFADIIHRSPVMKRVIARARRVAPRSVPVLIEGASGTGKELLARAIHRASPRRDKPLVTLNCGAIPGEVVESELFGHEKGAFTGAVRARVGYFEQAHGSTLFLDEIGELPKAAQVKLLRAVQEGEIVRVGSSKPVKVDVRIIAATNRVLTAEISKGNFREDLFYRLAVAVIRLPPLRERDGDLGLLIDRLLDHVNAESALEPGYENKKLSAGARNLLQQHDWPGNVRELLNTLRRAAVWSTGAVIGEDDVRDALIVKNARTNEGGVLNKPISEGIDLNEIMRQVARHYLERALAEAQGNKTQAARLLGLPSYQTLSNWLKRYGIDVGTANA